MQMILNHTLALGLAVEASNAAAPEGVRFSLDGCVVSVEITTPCGTLILFR